MHGNNQCQWIIDEQIREWSIKPCFRSKSSFAIDLTKWSSKRRRVCCWWRKREETTTKCRLFKFDSQTAIGILLGEKRTPQILMWIRVAKGEQLSGEEEHSHLHEFEIQMTLAVNDWLNWHKKVIFPFLLPTFLDSGSSRRIRHMNNQPSTLPYLLGFLFKYFPRIFGRYLWYHLVNSVQLRLYLLLLSHFQQFGEVHRKFL